MVVNFHIVSNRSFPKRKELSDLRVASIHEKRTWLFSRPFIKTDKVLTVIIWWMIKRYLLRFSFASNFHNKLLCKSSIIFLGTTKQDCVIKVRNILSFFALINNSISMALSFHYETYQQSYRQLQSIFFVLYLDFILQCFYESHQKYRKWDDQVALCLFCLKNHITNKNWLPNYKQVNTKQQKQTFFAHRNFIREEELFIFVFFFLPKFIFLKV